MPMCTFVAASCLPGSKAQEKSALEADLMVNTLEVLRMSPRESNFMKRP